MQLTACSGNDHRGAVGNGEVGEGRSRGVGIGQGECSSGCLTERVQSYGLSYCIGCLYTNAMRCAGVTVNVLINMMASCRRY